MVTIVPSRFAGLRIDDDDEDFVITKSKAKSTVAGQKVTVNGTQSAAKANGQPQPQAQKKSKPKKPKKPATVAAQAEQWSQWQEKDSELMDNYFEKDLEQALMLSKLDFEANRTKYVQAERATKLSSKSKKTKPLTLQQFQCKVDKDSVEKEQERQRQHEETEYNKNYTFFQQVDRETKQIIHKEQIRNILQNRDPFANAGHKGEQQDADGDRDTPSPELSECNQLKAENAELKVELVTLRNRYKKICSILKSGEMKEKTELLVEIEKLKRVQEEMTSELTTLYAQLEQALSKSNRETKGKEKGVTRKGVRFDAASEVPSGVADKNE